MKQKAVTYLLKVISLTVLLGAVGGAAVSLAIGQSTMAAPAGTAFTYQGSLSDGGGPASGSYDFEFRLYTAAGGEGQVGPTASHSGVAVSNGLFTVGLDFGAGVFDGQARFLEIGVRPAGEGGFTILDPRQPLTAAPYALYSHTAPWDGLIDVPADFADGVDNDTLADLSCSSGEVAKWSGSAWNCAGDNNTTYSAGAGLVLSGTTFGVAFAGSGSASMVARSDHGHDSTYAPIAHNHDDRYYTQTELHTSGGGGQVHWNNLTNVPLSQGSRISPQQLAELRWFEDPGRDISINVGNTSRDVAFDGTHMWVTVSGSNTVRKISPVTHSVVATASVGTNPNGVAYGAGSIWVANVSANNVTRVNAATGAVQETILVNAGPTLLAFDGTHVWVTNFNAGNVSKINPATNTVVNTVNVQAGPRGIAFDGTHLWVGNLTADSLSRIDIATNAVTHFAQGQSVHDVVVDGRFVWVARHTDLVRLDRPSGVQSGPAIALPTGSKRLAYDGAHILVSLLGPNQLARINPVTMELVDTMASGTNPGGIGFDGTRIWITRQATTVRVIPPY